MLAVILAAGILLCFGAAAFNHHGGLESMRPFFAPDRGSGLLQTLNILAIAPWLFVGFEAISNSSSEFRFSVRKSFRVMLAALVTAVIAYTCLTSIPVLTLGEGASGWTGAVANLANSGNEPDYHAFDAASQFFGKAGIFIIGVTLIGAIFTNLVGNTVAASRLAAAMADDGALPSFLGGRNADGAPRNAVLAIAALAVLVVPLGRAVIGVVVDISILGAAVAYAYTSAAAFDGTSRAFGFDRGHLPLRHAVHDVRRHHDRHGVLPRPDHLVPCRPRHLHRHLPPRQHAPLRQVACRMDFPVRHHHGPVGDVDTPDDPRDDGKGV